MMISIGVAAGRVIARLYPENSVDLKLHGRRYRVGGSSELPRIERWHGRRKIWQAVALGDGEAQRVLRALAAMQWHKRAANER